MSTRQAKSHANDSVVAVPTEGIFLVVQVACRACNTVTAGQTCGRQVFDRDGRLVSVANCFKCVKRKDPCELCESRGPIVWGLFV